MVSIAELLVRRGISGNKAAFTLSLIAVEAGSSVRVFFLRGHRINFYEDIEGNSKKR